VPCGSPAHRPAPTCATVNPGPAAHVQALAPRPVRHGRGGGDGQGACRSCPRGGSVGELRVVGVAPLHVDRESRKVAMAIIDGLRRSRCRYWRRGGVERCRALTRGWWPRCATSRGHRPGLLRRASAWSAQRADDGLRGRQVGELSPSIPSGCPPTRVIRLPSQEPAIPRTSEPGLLPPILNGTSATVPARWRPCPPRVKNGGRARTPAELLPVGLGIELVEGSEGRVARSDVTLPSTRPTLVRPACQGRSSPHQQP
jgi:hypothetical protein